MAGLQKKSSSGSGMSGTRRLSITWMMPSPHWMSASTTLTGKGTSWMVPATYGPKTSSSEVMLFESKYPGSAGWKVFSTVP